MKEVFCDFARLQCAFFTNQSKHILPILLSRHQNAILSQSECLFPIEVFLHLGVDPNLTVHFHEQKTIKNMNVSFAFMKVVFFEESQSLCEVDQNLHDGQQNHRVFISELLSSAECDFHLFSMKLCFGELFIELHFQNELLFLFIDDCHD